MSGITLPTGYSSLLSLYETQTAIGFIKRTFEEELARRLNLRRVSAPLFVDPASGLNDNLSGVERPVQFELRATGQPAEIVHSLAKWKRLALHRYDFHAGKGLYTDMNAIRRDEDMDAIHSIYVDQWDWEKVLPDGARNRAYLEQTVREIVSALCDTQDAVCYKFPQLPRRLSREVTFITSQALYDLYPDHTAKERETLFVKEHPTTFLLQIGGTLQNGEKHDGRAPDYDDWTLNGDLLVWDDLLGIALELSSMGIRVDADTLANQLRLAGAEQRRELPFHKMLLSGELPQAIGGGIGQSRTCMLLLHKAHIGEVQVSLWDAATQAACAAANIQLL